MNGSRRYIGLFSIIAAGALLVAALADGGLRVKKILDEPKSAQQDTGKQAAKQANNVSYRVNDITRVHLFGHEPVKVAPKPREIKASKTTLKLDLFGVVASVDPHLARALISPNNRKIKSYAIGEVIDSTDAKLAAVDADAVTLERNGKYETLSMERRSIGDKTGKSTRAGTATRRTTKAANSNQPVAKTSNTTRKNWRSRFSRNRPPTVEEFKKNIPQRKPVVEPSSEENSDNKPK